MKRNPVIFFAAFIFVIFSCYRDIDMEKHRPEPDLVLYGVISADTAVMISISRTKFFTDTSRYETVNDAEISLTVNGHFQENMRWSADKSFYGGGVYLSDYMPQTGDAVRIEARTGYGDVWVEETVPAKVQLENVTCSYKLIYDSKRYIHDDDGNIIEVPDWEITYRITFTDNADIPNFYSIRIENPSPWNAIGNLNYNSEPVFIEQESVVDDLFGANTITGQGGRAFTDKLFNGQCYTLAVNETHLSSNYGDIPPALLYRRIILYSITESYYNYLKSMQMAFDVENSTNLSTFGFAEPVRIFSNIQGGAGIIATSNFDSFSIDLAETLPDY